MRTKSLKLIVVATILFSSCNMGAQDKDMEKEAEKVIKEMDKNEDGKVAKTEIKSPLTVEVFNKYDKNQDGFLNKEEAF